LVEEYEMRLCDYDDVVYRTWAKHESWDDRVDHAVLTILTEAAEVADIFKKSWYSPRHEGELDIEHLKEEIGDVLYGLVALAGEFDFTIEDCMKATTDKLMARYPEKF
jgi:NTP pyrophosphatase (non-canonical NTP hydrolase)